MTSGEMICEGYREAKAVRGVNKGWDGDTVSVALFDSWIEPPTISTVPVSSLSVTPHGGDIVIAPGTMSVTT